LDQTGGLIDTSEFYLGVEKSGVGKYQLSAGQVIANLQSIGWFGQGEVTQTGGSNSGVSILIGRGQGGKGSYTIAGGSLAASSSLYVGDEGDGTLRVTGADSLISTGHYLQNHQSTLVSELTEDGISRISASGRATIDGDWVVTDIGASPGRYDILRANQGISGVFDSVTMPTGNLKWGIENGTTLWVAYIPEPGSFVLTAIGILGLCFLPGRFATRNSREA
jgi:T5SS/PEP-CTERM-associated repeat protein